VQAAAPTADLGVLVGTPAAYALGGLSWQQLLLWQAEGVPTLCPAMLVGGRSCAPHTSCLTLPAAAVAAAAGGLAKGQTAAAAAGVAGQKGLLLLLLDHAAGSVVLGTRAAFFPLLLLLWLQLLPHQYLLLLLLLLDRLRHQPPQAQVSS
jgi:hypothetical protein